MKQKKIDPILRKRLVEIYKTRTKFFEYVWDGMREAVERRDVDGMKLSLARFIINEEMEKVNPGVDNRKWEKELFKSFLCWVVDSNLFAVISL